MPVPAIRKHLYLLAAIVLLWLLFAQTTFEARLTSLTTDEPLHIISGYSYLKTGDARLVEEHPLLVKSISALPVALSGDLGDPRQARGWPEGALVTVMRAMLLNYPFIDRLAFAARVPIMWLGMLLAALAYRWAADWRLGGPTAGLIALGLCVFDPNIVAHAQLATTDLGVTLFIFATWYALWRWMRRPSWTWLALTGSLLGMAWASKMTALLAAPLVALVICVAYAPKQSGRWRDVVRRAACAMGAVLGVMGIAALVLWAVYGFELRWIPGLPVPFPAASHLIPLARLFEHQRAGHSTFLLGQNSQMGWWYYFPLAFAIKTPLPTLILLCAAMIGFIVLEIKLWRGKELGKLWGTTGQAAMLLAFPIIYFASALFSTVDIGYRHLLPSLPFFFVFVSAEVAGRMPQIAQSPNRHAIWPLLVSALGVWYTVSAALVFPRPLEFFNELAGGASDGYKSLVDSNLDWGQSFKELKQYLDMHRMKHIHLSAMTFLEPTVYGLDYDPLPPTRKAPDQFPSRFNPQPGLYVISASSLQGVATPDINTFAFFRAMTPTARIGNALFVYDVPQALDGKWVAQCEPPPAPLEPENIAAGFARDIRLAYFDCAQSWWYPANDTPGWYILPPNVELPPGATLKARVRQSDGRPFYNVYWIDPQAIRAGRGPGRMSVDGPLELIGYTVDTISVHPGVPVQVRTFWRVKDIPNRPLSLMAHLAMPEGTRIAVGDGLGVQIEQWRIGDVIVQRHHLVVPLGTPPGDYAVQIGVYWLDTQERWPTRDENDKTSDKLTIQSVEVLH